MRAPCDLCGTTTEVTEDPRLPLLRVIACRGCRDQIANDCGWYIVTGRGMRGRGVRQVWTRSAEPPVEVAT